MKQSVSLETWQLVHGMTATEKAYFKKSLVTRSDGKLQTVFDIINRLTEFDEAQMLDKVKAAYSDTSAAYRLLRTTIMRSLVMFHASSSPTYEVNMLLTQAQIARNKRLFPLCKRLIDRGLKLVEEQELEMHRYLFWELRSTLPVTDPEEKKVIFKKDYENRLAASEFARVSAELSLMKFQRDQFNRWQRLSVESYETYKTSISEEKLLKDADQMESKGHMRLASRIRASMMAQYHALGYWEKSLDLGLQSMPKIEELAKTSDFLFRTWSTNMGNMMGLAVLVDRRSTFLSLQEKLSEMCTLRGVQDLEAMRSNVFFHISADKVKGGKLDEALRELTDLLSHAAKPEMGHYYDESLVRQNIQLIHFLKQDFHEVLKQCSEFLSDQHLRADVRCEYSVRWLDLAATFMLNDLRLFQMKHGSMERFIKKNGVGFSWESDILRMLKKSMESTQEDGTQLFRQLFENLLSHREELRVCIQEFDILTWVESLLKNRPMMELVKERYLK
ncbi:MAG: hypothetical protein GC178_10460 [Flavobacteriales bacterium]|nr:hypothetical protein [Flavobacteriales bacterium]